MEYDHLTFYILPGDKLLMPTYSTTNHNPRLHTMSGGWAATKCIISKHCIENTYIEMIEFFEW